jgi:two-component system, NtrC family, response regulator GlrR
MTSNPESEGPGPTWVLTQPDQGEVLVQQKVRLTVTTGPDRGRELVMDGDRLLMGTHPQNDLALTDPTISKHHAELQISQRGLVLRDLGSTNGTLANNLLVDQVRLPARAELVLGKTTIQVTLLDETVAHPLAAQDRVSGVLGRTPIMRALFTRLTRAAAAEVTVLIDGESGTGKELAALALHEHSPRAEGPFVVVDCGALPRGLIESELFGHERGAFTGATHSRQGAFEQAHGGTLFLDEIGELDLDLQPRLLRGIESREIKRVGGDRPQKVDIRVIAGTNRQLERRVAEGAFREDLFYRLAVIRLTMPPLRERREDIPLLVEHFLTVLGPMGGSPAQVPSKQMADLVNRPWPGNVRQLRNAVERMAVLQTLGGGELASAVVDQPHESGEGGIDGAVVEFVRRAQPYKVMRAQLLEAFEREYLTALLQRHEGNLTQSARTAQIDRVYLLRLLDKYDMRKRRDG